MDNSTPSIFSIGLKYGLISAVIGLVIYFGLYFIDPGMIYTMVWKVMLVGLIIGGVIMFFACKEYREDNNDAISFGTAFKLSLLVYMISAFVNISSGQIMKVIDPDLAEIEKQFSIETSVSMMERFGTPPDVIDEQIDQIEADLENQNPIMNIFWALVSSLVMGSIIALIVAAIAKRKPEIDLFGEAQNHPPQME